MITIKIIHDGNFKNVETFLCKYIKENTTCKVNEIEFADLNIYIKKSLLDENSFNFINKKDLEIRLKDDIVNPDYLIIICKTIFKKYNIDSLDFELPFKDINIMTNIEDKLSTNYDKDIKNKVYFKGKDEPNIELHTIRRAKGSLYYFTRRSFNDDESEKYSGQSLIKAITECNKYTGMSVFNENGKLIYKSPKNKMTPIQNYLDKNSKRAVINVPTGTGIYVLNENKKYHIPNGTEVIITKIHHSKTEIKIIIDKKKFTAQIESSYLYII